MKQITLLVTSIVFITSSSLLATVTESILPHLNQTLILQNHSEKQSKPIRVVSYNMLYNLEKAEQKLPSHHRWPHRLPRLIEYIAYAKPDIIGSQELQESQVKELITQLNTTYHYFGEQTRKSEGRSDVNAIFFNKERFELMEAKTVPFVHRTYQNGYTFCRFRDRINRQEFILLNMKLTWAYGERRLLEAQQIHQLIKELPPSLPLIVLGDFNTYPSGNLLYYYCTYIKPLFSAQSFCFNGKKVEEALTGAYLKDAKERSLSAHCGPLCSITHSKFTLKPFRGPQLRGFILDHIFVNRQIFVLTHAIDTAKVDGQYPSDHFPVVADLLLYQQLKP